MQQFTPDDSAIEAPACDTLGARFLAQVEAKAKAIYPDHGDSRAKYIREKTVEEINRLHAELSNAQAAAHQPTGR